MNPLNEQALVQNANMPTYKPHLTSPHFPPFFLVPPSLSSASPAYAQRDFLKITSFGAVAAWLDNGSLNDMAESRREGDLREEEVRFRQQHQQQRQISNGNSETNYSNDNSTRMSFNGLSKQGKYTQ